MSQEIQPENQERIDSAQKRVEELSRELAGAYLRCFSTDDGMRVLKDLRKKFGLHRLAFRASPSGRYDYLDAALRDGERHVMADIEAAILLANNGNPI